MNARFSKAEHLCSRSLIERLYDEGQRQMVFPYSVLWKVEPALPVRCQVLIVAPKRKLHHAVDRNRVKRLTRECYRQQKHLLLPVLEKHNLRITLSLVYIHNELLTYDTLMRKFQKLMPLLADEIQRHEESLPPVEVDAQ